MARAHVGGELLLEEFDLLRPVSDPVVAEEVLASDHPRQRLELLLSDLHPPGEHGASGLVRAGGPPSRASRSRSASIAMWAFWTCGDLKATSLVAGSARDEGVVRREPERGEVGGSGRQRKDLVRDRDPKPLAHERLTGLDSRPHVRMAGCQRS